MITVPKIWVGPEVEGGYTMLDDFAGVQGCYSFGIGGDVAWDLDLADRGLLVYQYDHAVRASPQQHKNFRFLNVGLGPTTGGEFINLPTILRINEHENTNNLIMKIDIEGDEWAVFDNLCPRVLNQFKQIVCEFHDRKFAAEQALRVYGLLAATHISVHHRVTKVGTPGSAEITFANRIAYRETSYGVCKSETPEPA